MPENPTYEPNRLWQVVGITALLTITGLATLSAFTTGVRQEILRRDGYKCTVCGATDHLEAAHWNHNRSFGNYDDPSNGRTLCTKHHLEDHLKRAGQNGLSREHNNWAINRLKQRLVNQEP